MDYSIYDAIRGGFGKVVFVIRHLFENDFREKILKKYAHVIPVELVFQELDYLPTGFSVPEGRVKPWGTNHAVLMGKKVINEPFAVINADDFYGADAYRTIYAELQRLPETGAAAMVGYLLKNTVTKYGTVSRGVCHTADGKLTDIRETLKIQLFPDGSIADVADGQRHELDGDSVVSMNFWGFSPAIFDGMEQYFHDFLRRVGDDPKAECLLPTMVGDLLAAGELRVSVLKSADRWFGMTYHEDRARVARELIKLHETGVYPEELR